MARTGCAGNLESSGGSVDAGNAMRQHTHDIRLELFTGSTAVLLRESTESIMPRHVGHTEEY